MAPSFRTGYEGMAPAIQSAFDSYYRRKEGQESRKFQGEQATLDRTAAMDRLKAELKSRGEVSKDEIAAADARLTKELNANVIENDKQRNTLKLGYYLDWLKSGKERANDRFLTNMKITSEEDMAALDRENDLEVAKLGAKSRENVANINASAMGKAEQRDQGMLEEARKAELSQAKAIVDKEVAEIMALIDKGWNWKKVTEKYGGLYGDKVESWQWNNITGKGKDKQMKSMEIDKFVRKNVAEAIVTKYATGELGGEGGRPVLTGKMLSDYFANPSEESGVQWNWLVPEVNWGEQPASQIDMTWAERQKSGLQETKTAFSDIWKDWKGFSEESEDPMEQLERRRYGPRK